MAKVKEATKITKKPPKTAPKRPKQLSENVVVESDSEGSKTGSSSGHDVDSESDAEKRRNTKKPRLERVKETEPTEPPVPDDTSSEGESGSSDGESSSESESLPDAATPKKPTTVPAKVNGIKRKAEATKVNGTVSEKRARTASLSEQSSEKSVKVADHASQAAPAPPYNPPAGYVPVDTSSAAHSFSRSQFEGKQIWHISAPSNVPLSSITELALDAIKTGEPILNHDGIDYIVAEDTSSNATTTIFIPGQDGYTPLPRSVDMTLHLQQKIMLPNLTRKQAAPETGSNAAANVNTAPISSVRPQPKGLKMRYRPPGFGDGDPGRIGSENESEDVEMAQAPATAFRFPNASVERQQTDGDGTEKKHKKKRKEKRRESGSQV